MRKKKILRDIRPKPSGAGRMASRFVGLIRQLGERFPLTITECIQSRELVESIYIRRIDNERESNKMVIADLQQKLSQAIIDRNKELS